MLQQELKERPGTRRRQRAESIEGILEAALRLFVSRGYRTTTVEQIAGETGLTKGAVYFYFKSKEAIMLQLLEQAEATVVDRMLADSAGVAATSVTGTIELQSMYGGLQVAVGVMCLMGLLRKPFEQVALHALLFIFAGLAVVRVSLALTQGDFSGYTVFAMSYESFCLLFLCWYLLLRKTATSPS